MTTTIQTSQSRRPLPRQGDEGAQQGAPQAPAAHAEPGRLPGLDMNARHAPLVSLYKVEPQAAWIVDGARTASGSARRYDAVHGELVIGTSQPIRAPLSLHSAVGGDHDGPNPGDYLAAALAGCFDGTLRVIANRLGIVLEELEVAVSAEVDARGTLCVSPDVPVAFQKMTLSVRVRPAAGTSPHMLKAALSATERSCVVLQTLRGGVEIELDKRIEPSAPHGE